jgi:hypothetical protein
MRNSIAAVINGWLQSIRRCAQEKRLDRLAGEGLNPFSSIKGSVSGATSMRDARRKISRAHMHVPNLSGFYHGTLRDWFFHYGLGSRCLLVSETKAVAEVFQSHFPGTDFITTDFYVDLQPEPKCDVVWDICASHPPAALSGFNSIVCQATLEHVVDPVQAVRNFASILEEDGCLFIQTHTPSYVYHPYPRDYLRFQPDWFQDLHKVVQRLQLLELLCLDGHAFAVYRRKSLQTST